MKLVIGIVGEKGSGKETFATLLSEYISGMKIIHTRSSDILSETLELWDLPTTRRNLQDLAIIMDNHYGVGTLTDAVSSRIDQAKADLVIFDGVRWLTDATMIRSFPKNILVYVTADISVRYKRTKARKAKVGEAFATLGQFLEEEKVATETDIPKIGALADITIDNSGSLASFKKNVQSFVKKYTLGK